VSQDPVTWYSYDTTDLHSGGHAVPGTVPGTNRYLVVALRVRRRGSNVVINKAEHSSRSNVVPLKTDYIYLYSTFACLLTPVL